MSKANIKLDKIALLIYFAFFEGQLNYDNYFIVIKYVYAL